MGQFLLDTNWPTSSGLPTVQETVWHRLAQVKSNAIIQFEDDTNCRTIIMFMQAQKTTHKRKGHTCANSRSHQQKSQEYFQQPSMNRILRLQNYTDQDLQNRNGHLIIDN